MFLLTTGGVMLLAILRRTKSTTSKLDITSQIPEREAHAVASYSYKVKLDYHLGIIGRAKHRNYGGNRSTHHHKLPQ